MIDVKDITSKSCVEYKLKKARETAISCGKILPQAIAAYAQTASRVMPPPREGAKARNIPLKLYYSKILPLTEETIAKSKRKKLFSIKKNQGFKFVVFKYKDRGKHLKLEFYKTQAEAKKNSRIVYRGLYKFLWGAKLPEIGVQMPTMFSKLLSNSPALSKKKDLVSVSKVFSKKEQSYTITYRAAGIDFFARKAKQNARKAMKRKFQSELKKITKSA